MRPVVVLLAAGVVMAGCSGHGATAPSATPTSATPAGPMPVRVWLCCGSDQVLINTQRQIEARATYPDGSIKDVTNAVTSWKSSNLSVAPVSSTGLVSGIAAGTFDITATYQGLEGRWGLYVWLPVLRPPAADEITGYVQEVTGLGPVDISRAEVEVVGGPDRGRTVPTSSGFFRIDHLQAAGFDLVVRERGYSSARIRMDQLGREVIVNLSPAPTVVSDMLEGDVCWPTRTITRAFTPAAPGFLRITAGRWLYTARALYADGALVDAQVPDNKDVELLAGVRYELRVTGRCDYGPTSTARISFLRPR